VLFDCGGNSLCVIVRFGKGARARERSRAINLRLEPTLPKFNTSTEETTMAKKKKKKKMEKK